jgi:gluconolactonase
MHYIIQLLPILLLLACGQKKETPMGSVEKFDASLDALLDANAQIEILAEGFDWSEGPLWIEKESMLLFSDVPQNTVYKWTAAKGKERYLTPSGYTGAAKRGGEMGSNGLALNPKGQLVLCQHGDRQVGIMQAPVGAPKSEYAAVANQYNGKKFNSPNDLVFDSKGNLYFTDPPYGLEKNMDDSSKELPFQGVYHVRDSGTVTLLVDSITRPNGIALTPDEKHLLIANSDPQKPWWYIYDLKYDCTLENGRILHDASEALKVDKGLPDGMKIDRKGNVFASGPGGIWIFNPEGTLLGKIKFPELVSNCALSADEKILYVTADMYLLRVRLRK